MRYSVAELETMAREAVRRAIGAGAEEAEAFVEATSGADLKIEADRIANASYGEDFGIGIRVLAAGRIGFAYCTDPADVARAAREAASGARLLAPSALRFAPPARVTPVAGLVDRRIPDLSLEDGLDACRLMMDVALSQHPDIVLAGGGMSWGEEAYALATSAGFAAATHGTHAGASLFTVLRNGETSTGFEFAHGRAFDFDPVAIGYGAARMALDTRRARRAESGLATVVFRPTALDGLVEGIVGRGLTGDVARAGQSPWTGKAGEAALPEPFSLVDDGRFPGGPMSAPFDDEGTPTGRVELVAKGRLAGFLEDRAASAKEGVAATGSAVRADRLDDSRTFRAPPRAVGRNLLLDGPREEDVLRDVKEGVLVVDALGAHTANAASGDFSVNSTVLFRIRDGEIAHALKPVMLSGNLPQLLLGLDGLGGDDRWVGQDFSAAAVRLPSVRLRGVRVTA